MKVMPCRQCYGDVKDVYVVLKCQVYDFARFAIKNSKKVPGQLLVFGIGDI